MAAIIRLFRDESGATMVEYGLIVALVFLAMITGVAALGQSLGDLFNFAARELTAAMRSAVKSGTSGP